MPALDSQLILPSDCYLMIQIFDDKIYMEEQAAKWGGNMKKIVNKPASVLRSVSPIMCTPSNGFGVEGFFSGTLSSDEYISRVTASEPSDDLPSSAFKDGSTRRTPKNKNDTGVFMFEILQY